MRYSIVSTLLALAPAALAGWHGAGAKAIKYSTVTGFFLQDESTTNATNFDYTAHNFGLLNRTYPTDERHHGHHEHSTQWERFAKYLAHLNSGCRKDGKTQYKILFLGRHGEGYHNAAESFYGTPAWNCYWGELDGNGTATWDDALLTPNGYQDAYKANAYFKSRFEVERMPYFQSYYSSPLSRCVLTANATFADLALPRSHAFKPTIKELLREGISLHTCDRRSTKTQIHALAPHFAFERGFAEDDELWHRGESETSAHQFARSTTVLDDIFASDDASWISITSHSGEIASILSVLGHRAFSLSTGEVIPVLVKAELVKPTATTTSSYVGFTPQATCNAPPVTSLADQGCVCSTTTPTPTPA